MEAETYDDVEAMQEGEEQASDDDEDVVIVGEACGQRFNKNPTSLWLHSTIKLINRLLINPL